MKKKILLVTMILLAAGAIVGCADSYRLRIENPATFTIEKTSRRYRAGETVTIKMEPVTDVGVTAYLDDESLGGPKAVKDEHGRYYWEFTFVMPARDAVLRFETEDGMLVEPTQKPR